MSTIVTRAGKGAPLSNTEMDANFTNLNTDKYQSGATASFASLLLTGSTAPVNGIYLPAANSVGLATASTERMRIDSSGNIGVGTTTPRYQTTGAVAGVTTLTVYNAATGGGGIELATNSTTATGVAGRLTFTAAQNTDGSRTIAYIDSLIQGSTSANQGGSMRFATKPDNGAIAVAMTINSAGYVGIGTTSPTCALHVSGTVQAQFGSTYAQLFADGGSAFLSSAGAYPLSLQTNSANRLTVDANGKVGIATSGQTFQFSVFGSASRFSEMNGDNIRMRLAASEGGWGMRYSFNANDGTELGGMYGNGVSQAINSISWNFGATQAMTLASGGSLGIGTDTSANLGGVKVDARQNANANYSTTFTTGTTKAVLSLIDQSSVGTYSTPFSTLLFGAGETGAAWATITGIRQSSQNSAIAFGTASGSANTTERMRITSGGFVGIGTTDPSYKFVVASADEASTTLIGTYNLNAGSGSAGLQFLLYHTGADVTLGNYRSGALSFTTNNITRMYIGATGKVGIGTTNPTYFLDLNSSQTTLRIRSGSTTSTDKPTLNFYHDGNDLSEIKGGAGFTFVAGGTTSVAYLNSTGNLMVNATTNPLGGIVYANGRLAARGFVVPIQPKVGTPFTTDNFGEAWYSGAFNLGGSATITLWDNTAAYATQFFEIFVQSDYGPRLTTWYRGQCSGYGGSVTALEVNNGNAATFTITPMTPGAGQCRVQMTNSVASASNFQVWVKFHATGGSYANISSSYIALN